ncbi:MAG: S-methyl-5-thioribose-1-phosphate isomerase [Azoarcus sp.]|jgi:methylthioribose-1-phosphate isomerase|nr:S-methyl-5-thioribose-1-phosphate isomerase [Azoarcus sp.]
MFIQPIPVLRREGNSVVILDQTALPWIKVERRLITLEDAAEAIASMRVRGAPLIGIAAAHGVALALALETPDDIALGRVLAALRATRPTAVNLAWALARMETRLRPLPVAARREAAWAEAASILVEDAAACEAIGAHGLDLFRVAPAGRPLRVMTHCNAGWLATAGAGTALAPVYAARAAGIALEVVVSETRPRNQGLLTAWELAAVGIDYVLIADNAAGFLLARGEIDIVIVGADRIAANGDTVNKIGTYLKALAAQASQTPFYVAAPLSSFDAGAVSGAAIPIEERPPEEVLSVAGFNDEGFPRRLRLAQGGARVFNPAFDSTPAAFISGFITERGVFSPERLDELAQGVGA